MFYRGILDVAQAGESLRRNGLLGFTEVQPNSLARVGTWGHVPSDGTGKQETWDTFSWTNAELRGFLSSGRGRSVQKLCLVLEPRGEKRNKAKHLLDEGALGQLLKHLTPP